MDQADPVEVRRTPEDWLRSASLALDIPGPDGETRSYGTGFVVAPGIVATCAHVLAESSSALPGTVRARHAGSDRTIELEPVAEWYFRQRPGDVDLAFLRIREHLELSTVLLSPALTVGDALWVFGHPAGRFRGGQSALFIYQGSSIWQAGDQHGQPSGEPLELERVFGTPVGSGYSGSAVLNRRSGAVCGMLTLSDKSGSAHLVSGKNIAAALVRVLADNDENREWLDSLTDDQIRAGGWRYPGPTVRQYLALAAIAAQAQPYPGVLPGRARPPLSAIYVNQQASALSVSDQDGLSWAPTAVPAEMVFDGADDAWVIGGPGSGKSSLLRSTVLSEVRRWRNPKEARAIPVRVLAADLACHDSVSAAIAASVRADLAKPVTPWPAEMFATAPLPDVPWLVLVDGFDEVADARSRRAVLVTIAAACESGAGSYRFVVATRPLPEAEMNTDDVQPWSTRRYELRSFTSDELHHFAYRWFAALELPDPAQAATSFATAIDRGNLTGIAQSPLMATMLGQLYVERPERPLPLGRARIYRRFVALLLDRQYDSPIYAQTRDTFARYGPAAQDAGVAMIEGFRVLLARLAATRRTGYVKENALELLNEWTAPARPDQVSEMVWTDFLRELLRRCGLLVERGGDFFFIHETIADYLAAEHVTGSAALNRTEFRRLFRYSWQRPRRSRWQAKIWRHPSQASDSYYGFLIAAWQDDPAQGKTLSGKLHRLAARGGLAACEFLADRVAEGIAIEPTVVATAVEALAAFTATTSPKDVRSTDVTHMAAINALGRIATPRALAILNGLALADRSRLDTWAAEALVRIGTAPARDHLAAIAGTTTADAYVRADSATNLAGLGDYRGIPLLYAIATHDTKRSGGRVRAAASLLDLHDSRAPDLLAALMHDTTIHGTSRVIAAATLAQSGDRRGHDALARMTVTAADGFDRVAAAARLARLGDKRGHDALTTLAADVSLGGAACPYAAELLAELGDERSRGALIGIATGTVFRHSDRVAAAARLAGLTDARGPDLLVVLATHFGVDRFHSRDAVEALRALTDSRADQIEDLASYSDDNDTRHQLLFEAAAALVAVGETRVTDYLADLLLDTDLDQYHRVATARILAELQDQRGGDALHSLATDPAVGDHTRLRAGRILAERADRRGHGALADIASDPAGSPHTRADAGTVLAALDDDRGREALVAMVASDDLIDQVIAGRALAELGDQRGNDALATAASTVAKADRFWRLEAARALARLGDERGWEVLTTLARKRFSYYGAAAADTLAELRRQSTHKSR